MGLSILIVDDSRMVRKIMTKAVSQAAPGATISDASDGAEALEKIRQTAYDLMLLDINMPNVDGFEVLQAMRDEGISLKTFVISANIQPKAVERVKGLGALGFIEKPGNREKVETALKEHGIL